MDTSEHAYLVQFCNKIYCHSCDILLDQYARYSCDQCEYKTSHKGNMTLHKKMMYNGFMHTCYQCKYKCTQYYILFKHTYDIHTWVRHSCEQCKCKAMQQCYLNIQPAIHNEVKYSCDQCDNKITHKSNQTMHYNQYTKVVVSVNIKLIHKLVYPNIILNINPSLCLISSYDTFKSL